MSAIVPEGRLRRDGRELVANSKTRRRICGGNQLRAELSGDEGPIRRLRAAARDAKRLRDRIEEAQEVNRQRSLREPAWGSRKDR